MKQAITLFCLLCLGLNAEGQIKKVNEMNLIGIDMTSVIRHRRADITVSHGFAGKWSLSGKAGIYLASPYSKVSDEEYSHRAEFSEIAPADTFADYICGCISIEHWIRECFKGPFFSIGGRYGVRRGFDCAIGAGYIIRIRRNLAARLAYEMDILSSYRSGKIEGEGTTIGINIIF